MIISPLVLTEVDHLAKARFGSQARTAIIDFVLAQAGQSRFQIPETGLEVLEDARTFDTRAPRPSTDWRLAVHSLGGTPRMLMHNRPVLNVLFWREAYMGHLFGAGETWRREQLPGR